MTGTPWRQRRSAGDSGGVGGGALRLLGQYPHILAAAAALTGDDIDDAFGGDARHAAGQDLVAVRRGDGIDTHRERARRKAHRRAGAPGRRLR